MLQYACPISYPFLHFLGFVNLVFLGFIEFKSCKTIQIYKLLKHFVLIQRFHVFTFSTFSRPCTNWVVQKTKGRETYSSECFGKKIILSSAYYTFPRKSAVLYNAFSFLQSLLWSSTIVSYTECVVCGP